MGLLVTPPAFLGVVKNERKRNDESEEQKSDKGQQALPGVEEAALGAQREFLRAEPARRFGAREAVGVDELAVVLHGRLGLKLRGRVTEEAKAGGGAVAERIGEVAAEVDPVQDVGCRGTRTEQELGRRSAHSTRGAPVPGTSGEVSAPFNKT